MSKDYASILGVANSTSTNVGLGKFWKDLEISEAFFINLVFDKSLLVSKYRFCMVCFYFL